MSKRRRMIANPKTIPTLNEKRDFLEKDLADALKWLFVGAVVWQAAKERPEKHCHQKALGMFMSFVQARALYEFYCKQDRTSAKGNKSDDARAGEFCDSWTCPDSDLYRGYMRQGQPANKRVFHLVYGRSKEANAGGPGHSGPSHMNEQVLKCARDLRQITQAFTKCAKAEFTDLVQLALQGALNEAANVAAGFNIANPL